MVKVIVNIRNIPVTIPNPDPRYQPIAIPADAEGVAIDGAEGWHEKICQQIKGLKIKGLGD